MSEELRPCPFCNKIDSEFKNESILPVYILCNWCGSQGPSVYEYDEEKARAAWNERI